MAYADVQDGMQIDMLHGLLSRSPEAVYRELQAELYTGNL